MNRGQVLARKCISLSRLNTFEIQLTFELLLVRGILGSLKAHLFSV